MLYLLALGRYHPASCRGAALGKRYLRVYPAAAAVACFRLGGVNPPAVAEKKD